MIDATLSTVFNAQHLLFALDRYHSEASYGVILGLLIIAAAEIGAGLWLIHAGEAQHHHRRR
jgi:hypothetical protein